MILIDDALVDAYYAKVTGAVKDDTSGGYFFPCKTTLPDLWFMLGGAKQVVPGAYMNLPGSVGEGNNSTMCYGGVQSNGGGQSINVLGNVFMKGKYIVHDHANGYPRMGFAPLTQP